MDDEDNDLNSEERKIRLRGMQVYARPRKGTPEHEQYKNQMQSLWSEPVRRANIKKCTKGLKPLSGRSKSPGLAISLI